MRAFAKPDGRELPFAHLQKTLGRKQFDDLFDLRNRIAHRIVGIERFEIPLEYALRFGAAHNIGHEGLAKGAAQFAHALHAGARRIGHVDRFEFPEAIRAVTALGRAIFKRRLVAEIIEDIAAQTARRVAIPHHGLEHAALSGPRDFGLFRLLGGILAVAFDKETAGGHVAIAPQKKALARLAIASRAPRLLIIRFKAFRHVVMHDPAHVRLVDSHAKGIRRNHNGGIVIDEPLLGVVALGLIHAGMVASHRQPFGGKPARKAVNIFARRAIHDARIARMRRNELGNSRALLLRIELFDAEFQIRAIVTRHDAFGVSQPKQSRNVAAHFIGRRGGKRNDGRPLRQAFDEIGDASIGRAKILAPLRHAMGLVNGDKGNFDAACEFLE